MSALKKAEKDTSDELHSSIDWKEEEVEMSELIIPIKREEDEESSVSSSEPLSAKTRVRYERHYQTFQQWCNQKGFNNYTDEDVLLEYFRELVAQNKRSLWALYSMLKSCILIHKNIDISQYSRLLAYLKSQCPHVQSKKSRALSEYHINLFIDQADDEEFLLMKVALIIGVSGALHRGELYNMVINNLELKTDVIIVTILEDETNKSRQFVIMNSKWVAVVRKYLELRLKVSKIKDRFFINYHQGQCIGTPMGITAIGRIPSKIAEYLNLDNPEEYTGHCFRRSSTTLLRNYQGYLSMLISKPAGEENILKRKVEEAQIINKKI